MKPFINHDLFAPNVLTASVDSTIVSEFSNLDSFRGPGFARVAPRWKSDIQWISASTPETFVQFQSAFDRLRVADHVLAYVEVDRSVRLYSGFLVVRNECSEPDFHFDWKDAGNQAFTFMTPISGDFEAFGLLYKKLSGEVGNYEYKSGEAIIFGDDFLHSTKPGRAAEPTVLLSFVFGTDRMEHWAKIYPNISRQTPLLRRPDGEFLRTDEATA